MLQLSRCNVWPLFPRVSTLANTPIPSRQCLLRHVTATGTLRRIFDLTSLSYRNLSTNSSYIRCFHSDKMSQLAIVASSISRQLSSIAPGDEHRAPLHASVADGDVPRLQELLASSQLPFLYIGRRKLHCRRSPISSALQQAPELNCA